MKKILNLFAVAGLATMLLTSCDKTKEYDVIVPPAQAHFMNKTTVNYSILSTSTPALKIPIGVTKAAAVDRTVTISVSSNTATPGTDYTVSGTSITIPAGQVIDSSFTITGIYASYVNGERDTLKVAIIDPEVTPSDYNDTLTVILRGPCFEGDVTRTALLGAYNNTIETFGTGSPYGPYSTAVTAFTTTSATTGVITVTNIWDNGWGPIQFNVDWTDPANRVVTAVAQAAIPGSNAGDLSATYAGQTVAVRAFTAPSPANTGTFSACNQTFTLRMQLGVTGVGYFGNIYTVNLGR